MALDNTKVLKAGTGHFYTAPVGTALPTDLRNPGAEWTHMGHTSAEDILSAASEGGESSVLRSLQNTSLKQSITPRTEGFNMNLLQFDVPSLRLYYGANASVTPEGNVRVPSSPIPTEVAWLVVFYDGYTNAGIYAEKASIFRSDDFAVSDTENLASLPLRVTPLQNGTNSWPYEFIPPQVHKVQATATASTDGDAVTAVTVTDGGSGYESAPAVTFTGVGTGAAATAVLVDGVVTEVNVTSGGTGYTTAPTVEIAAP